MKLGLGLKSVHAQPGHQMPSNLWKTSVAQTNNSMIKYAVWSCWFKSSFS